MKEVFVPYAAYNLWANNLLLSAIEALPEEKQTAEITSSFPSLFKTVLHLLDAESMWWQRIRLQENVLRPSDSFNGNFEALSKALQYQDKQWLDWVTACNEHGFQHEFIYFNSKRERFKQPVYQVLLQVFNHSTHHRGQMITMLRESGVERLPATDFIVWSRKR